MGAWHGAISIMTPAREIALARQRLAGLKEKEKAEQEAKERHEKCK
jgi:hypothetical protein